MLIETWTARHSIRCSVSGHFITQRHFYDVPTILSLHYCEPRLRGPVTVDEYIWFVSLLMNRLQPHSIVQQWHWIKVLFFSTAVGSNLINWSLNVKLMRINMTLSIQNENFPLLDTLIVVESWSALFLSHKTALYSSSELSFCLSSFGTGGNDSSLFLKKA